MRPGQPSKAACPHRNGTSESERLHCQQGGLASRLRGPCFAGARWVESLPIATGAVKDGELSSFPLRKLVPEFPHRRQIGLRTIWEYGCCHGVSGQSTMFSATPPNAHTLMSHPSTPSARRILASPDLPASTLSTERHLPNWAGLHSVKTNSTYRLAGTSFLRFVEQCFSGCLLLLPSRPI